MSAQPKPRRMPTDIGLRPEHSIAPNVLERDFAAAAPNRKWAADFTYIWTGEGWLFLAVVVDLFSRRVVGWSMQPTMTAQLVLDALIMALWRRGKPSELLPIPTRAANTPARTSSACCRPRASPAA
ncbi:MAG: DDE-type integrase/transposase/recombinase [Betaproteobacteria bacterium]|nr:DDE-type integrase/transposase/recombinase [Betaproteobacteria bacterium]